MEGSAVKLRQRSNGRRGSAPCFGTMKVVSVINYKGGVGKTTLTACLASCLVNLGKKVLAVDMDAQCNLTYSATGEDTWDKISGGKVKSLRDWYGGICGDQPAESLDDLILSSKTGNFSLAPSHLDLLDVDMELANHIASVNEDKRRRRYVNVLSALRRQLWPLAKERKVDLVLLDCPPNFNIVTQTAIVASHQILIPARPNPLSTVGIDHLIRKRGQLVEIFNKHAAALGIDESATAPQILGVVPMMWKSKEGNQRVFGNVMVEEELADMVGELSRQEGQEVVLFKGLRLNESIFSRNKAFHALWRENPPGVFYNGIRHEMRLACREIGEHLGLLEPLLLDDVPLVI